MAALVPGASDGSAGVHADAMVQLRRGLVRTAFFVAGFVGFVAVGSQVVG